VENNDDTAHTFDVVLTREPEELVFWETITLDPGTFRPVPSSWEETGSFSLSVRVDGRMSGTRRAPDDVALSFDCWFFNPKVTRDGDLDVSLLETSCSSVPERTPETTTDA